MSLRICLINDDLYPSRWTNTQQTVKTAAGLAHDAEVELVLPRMWDVFFTSHERRLAQLSDFYGVSPKFGLTQLAGWPASKLRIPEKLVHGILAPIYAAYADHDVIYSRNVLPMLVGLAMGKPVVWESHRVLKKHYKGSYAAIKALMRHPNFLGVVTNAAMIADSFVEMGFESERVLIAHNCYDPADMEPELTKAEARTKLGLPASDKIVCYAGHIQRRKGIDTIVAIAAKTPELHYVICGGDPTDVATAQQLAREAGAQNMTFTGWIDVADLSPYLYAADVLLIPPTAAPLQQHGNTVMPIKTYTYLAAGRVIVGPKQEDVREVLKHGINCLLVEPDQLDAAVATIRDAFADPARMERIGAAAKADAPLYTWEARSRQIIGWIEGRLAARGAAAEARSHA